ncbi:DNA-binding response regulator, partial [Streptomyces sp. NPDC054835]
MLRVLAVDDEAPALGELLYLLRADPRVRSAEGAGDATEALRRIGRAL